MKKKLIKDVKSRFQTYFKANPILVFAPGRINLIGEHTDYNDGLVFPAAINKGIAVALSISNSDFCKVLALDLDETLEFDTKSLRVIENGSWRNYILGVVSEIQKLGLEVGNFNAVFAGNIPSGSGMSSSAALENGFVFGLNSLFNLGLSKHQMIHISMKAEHNFVGVKCGIMDQYASMFGQKNTALLLDCRTLFSDAYKIDFSPYQILLINSNVKHDLAETAYNDRRSVCDNVALLLNKKSLRDASKEDLKSLKGQISENDYNKCLYVIQEIERVKLFGISLSRKDFKAAGNLLYQSHEGLSSQYQVSCPELDFLVKKSTENSAILGSRMMGGGFGGCTINLILKSKIKVFKQEISKAYKEEYGIDCSFYKVKLSEGTRLIDYKE